MVTCRNCGRLDLDSARFCSECGTALEPARTREVRKTVTVLFADVTGSTELGEALDPEAFRRVMARYFDLARQCVERHGGTVEKFIGDAVMAVFGIPAVHEDDALRAVRAAGELRDSFVSLNNELSRDHGVLLRLRTGLNTGLVVTGTEERLATGDAVNVAARLEQAAQPGEILIGGSTLGLTRHAIEVEPVEPLSVKGKSQPLAAYRLLRVSSDAPAFDRRLDASLVGRREELAVLRRAFDSAVAERRCRLVTVLGPPGIGKSRLARELESALAGEATVLFGRCLPYGEGITYWPLVEIFREAGGADELAAALSAGAPEEIFWAVRKAFERRARERAVALVVDDIHWAEPTFLDLIEHLADWTRDAPLLVLTLARPEFLDQRPGWGGERIALELLSDDEADALIANLLGEGELDPKARARIRRVAEGNPLFVEQLLAMLAEGSDLQEVPETIHALLSARLDSLPSSERDVLERASVIGLDFEWSALGELASDGLRPPGACIAALVRKGFVRPHEAIEDLFRFQHVLIRDAAYERLPKELRSELHERFAGWLGGRGEEFEEIVGYHLEQAYRSIAELGPPGERAQTLALRAAEHLAAAGNRAIGRADELAAVNLLERALALLPDEDLRRPALRSQLGRALVEVGRLDEADEVLAEAIERAGAAGAHVVEADAAVSLAELRIHTAPQEDVGQGEVWQELEKAIPLFEQVGEEAALARALGLAGTLRFWGGEAAIALETYERAARHARRAGDHRLEVEILGGMQLAILLGPMSVTEALAEIEDVGRREVRSSLLYLHLLRVCAHLEAMAERFDVARDLVVRAKRLAEDLGQEVTLARISLQAGPIELLAGDPVAAERELRPAYETLERIGHLGYLTSVAPRLAEALFLQGRDEEALRLTEVTEAYAVPPDVDAQVGWRRVRANVLAHRGAFQEAERLADEAVALAARTDYLDNYAQAVADRAAVLGFAGRVQEAAAGLEHAIVLHERKGNAAAARALRARLATLAGGDSPAPARTDAKPS